MPKQPTMNTLTTLLIAATGLASLTLAGCDRHRDRETEREAPAARDTARDAAPDRSGDNRVDAPPAADRPDGRADRAPPARDDFTDRPGRDRADRPTPPLGRDNHP